MSQEQNGNPNHPVVLQMQDQWHKIAAMMMQRMGIVAFRITPADLSRLASAKQAIVADCRGGDFVVRLVSELDAEQLARAEGGLPH